MYHKCLKLVTYNVRSLVDTSRRVDLLNTLSHNRIDVGFIQECHVKNTKIRLSGYNVIYDNSRIGVAVMLKNSIKFSQVDVGDIGFFGTFIQIELKMNNSIKRILLGSVYIPCNYSLTGIHDGLNKILVVSRNFDGFLIGGDLNTKNRIWGDQNDNSNGRALQIWLQDNILDVFRVCDSSPSFPNGSSYLDHFLIGGDLINIDDPNFKVSSLPTFSDHFPIKVDLKLDSFDFVIRSPRTFTSFENTNWDHFRRDLEIFTSIIMPPDNINLRNIEIDQLIEEFTSLVNRASNLHSKKIELKENKIYISDKIKNFFQIKHRWQKELKKIFHRTGNRLSPEYNILSKQIHLLKTIIKELINLEQAEIFNQRLGKIKPGPTAFKKIYNVIGKNKSPFCDEIVYDDVTINDDDEKCKLFQRYYTSVYDEQSRSLQNEDLSTRVSNAVNNIPCHIYSFDNDFNSFQNVDTYHFIKIDTIKDITRKINSKKSSGMDNISNYLIKKFPQTAFKFLTIIYNNCINNGYFPTLWKKAKILPIKKKKESRRMDEFRPISLISNLGKILEHILKTKLDNDFIVDPLSCFQFGFRQSHSTVHALLKFHSDVTRNLRNQKCSVAISLDIQKAFDTANHTGILYKLLNLGIDPYLLKLFQSYFLERKFNIQINNSYSDYGDVKSGVPQGSVLAPILFNLFLNDFPHETIDSAAILYADDCLIFSHDDSPTRALDKASTHLQIINDYYKTWGISINATKSEAICIRNASGKCPRYVVPESKLLHLFLDGAEIPFKNRLKYLGITFDKLMKFNHHGRNILSKVRRITGMFSSLLNSPYLHKNTKLLIYKVAIRSVLVYGFPIWFTISPTVAREIERFERKIIRKCINMNFATYTRRFSNGVLYDTSSIIPFCTYAFSLTKKFVEKLNFHDNSLLKDIYDFERNFNWSGSGYLSPIGILGDETPSEFYMKSLPGSHRG